MWRSITAFIAERCPLKAVLPLAAVLYGAPSLVSGFAWRKAVIGALSTALGLIVLRMADDLADLPGDRHTHPERGMAAGRIDPAAIKKTVYLGILVLSGMNIFGPHYFLVAMLIVGYWLYYRFRTHLPQNMHPWAVNAVFFAIPVHAGGWSADFIWMALFTGLAVTAHDISHSIHAPGEDEGHPSLSNAWGAQNATTAAAAINLASTLAGIRLWHAMGRPMLFIWTLAATTAWLAVLYARLFARPGRKRARAFYLPGFLFFLLPLAALMLDMILQRL